MRGKEFRKGMRDGLPIALGYFSVAFSLGIAARNVGLTVVQGVVTSLLNNASAGEYAGFTTIGADASYLEMALITLVANARYLLMSTALSQHIDPKMPFWQRLTIGYDVTDELFGIYVAHPGMLPASYAYGAMSLAIPGWAGGTALGIFAGQVLPDRIVSALSVALYGMFLAIIIPPARKDKVVALLVLLAFASSWASGIVPWLSALSNGTRTIILTVAISGAAALLFPVKEEAHAA
ncbi:MAG: AzlC family ABC transporter permease [Sphaerochaetaceae bacterium]|nr:AzlC family ABC transporter permease [Spirochaetales bacterium]MDY5499244.1 AzlC family ABC transporter permease [Sphaerochaetaceae bacterium]